MHEQLARFWLKLLVLGAVSFWTPDVIVHLIAPHSFSGVHVLVLTILLPVCFTSAYVVARRRYRDIKAFIALPMLVGLWTLGGLFMTVSASFSGGGFASPGGVRETFLVILLSFLPPYTFIMATYDGSLFALLLATVAGVFAALVLKPTHVAAGTASPTIR